MVLGGHPLKSGDNEEILEIVSDFFERTKDKAKEYVTQWEMHGEEVTLYPNAECFFDKVLMKALEAIDGNKKQI